MANLYVYSGAGGAATGADWANAYLTLAAAVDDGAGNDVWVAHDHAESTAGAVTIASAGTLASPVKIHCVNRAGSVPPVAADLATTATVTCTGGNNMTIAGVAYVRGITFNAGSGAVSNGLLMINTATLWHFENCAINVPGTSSPFIIFGNTSVSSLDYKIRLVNCTISFGSTSATIHNRGGTFEMIGGSIAATGSVPTGLFNMNSIPHPGSMRLVGVDLSNFTTGSAFLTQPYGVPALFENCKLHATNPTLAGTPTSWSGRANFVRCGANDTTSLVIDTLFTYFGTKTVETTIVRTGGATDGTTPIAHKFVTTANSKWGAPFIGDPIVFWNETVGSSITVTLEGIWGGGAVPTNAEIWFEADYMGTAGNPITTRATCGTASSLTTGSNHAAGSGTWGGSTTKFAMAMTITPQEKGPIRLRVVCAKASDTFYIDPKPVIT